jgi:hypothetical protein
VKSRAVAVVAVLALGAAAVMAALAIAGGASTSSAPASPAPMPPGHGEDLECRSCHVQKHRSVTTFGSGAGARGVRIAKDRMFEVGVQCVACHNTATGDAVTGRTFKTTESACTTCHGDRYRGMVPAWRETFAKLRDIATAKISAGRAALAKADAAHAGRARATKLLDDAEFNVRFLTAAHPAHNVFSAARVLDLAGRWGDDAARATGGQPAKIDDRLARGGYCAALCHETAGMKALKSTVTFRKTPLPHTRHVAELGATCITCHSADTHRALVAAPSTCAACHHAPQNDRCEGCHKTQSAFYRGTASSTLAKIEPNSMAAAVGCIGCHDLTKKHTRAAVGEKCLTCHDKSYEGFVSEWTTGLDAEMKKTLDVVAAAEAAVTKSRRAGRQAGEAERLLKDARDALALVRSARGAHNPPAADALLGAAREKAAAAQSAARAAH